jgi:hypothetical protein
VATVDERESTAVPGARPAAPGGDDLTIDTTPPSGNGRRGLVAAIVAILVVLGGVAAAVAVTNRRSSAKVESARTVTPPAARLPIAKAPSHAQPPRPHAPASNAPVIVNPPAKNVAPPAPSPAASAPPVPAPAPIQATPPTNVAVPPPVAPPAPPIGPNVLRFTMDPGRTITIPAGGTVTLSVTVHNPATRVAYLPLPLGCLWGAPGVVCAQHTQNVAPGATLHQTFTLSASDYTTTPTQLKIGGYAIVTVKVAS